jgi:hypothetical protein
MFVLCLRFYVLIAFLLVIMLREWDEPHFSFLSPLSHIPYALTCLCQVREWVELHSLPIPLSRINNTFLSIHAHLRAYTR